MNDKLTDEEADAGDRILLALFIVFGMPLWLTVANIACVLLVEGI